MEYEEIRVRSDLVDRITSEIHISERYGPEGRIQGLLAAVQCQEFWAQELQPETVEELRKLEEKYDVRLMCISRQGYILDNNKTYYEYEEKQHRYY